MWAEAVPSTDGSNTPIRAQDWDMETEAALIDVSNLTEYTQSTKITCFRDTENIKLTWEDPESNLGWNIWEENVRSTHVYTIEFILWDAQLPTSLEIKSEHPDRPWSLPQTSQKILSGVPPTLHGLHRPSSLLRVELSTPTQFNMRSNSSLACSVSSSAPPPPPPPLASHLLLLYFALHHFPIPNLGMLTAFTHLTQQSLSSIVAEYLTFLYIVRSLEGIDYFGLISCLLPHQYSAGHIEKPKRFDDWLGR